MMSEMEIERYTSQRWRPTDDQVQMMTRIYNFGVTHPSRAQVVEITSRLRIFGDASEYNVHCWFNNHGNRVRRWQAEIDPTGTQFSQLPLYMYDCVIFFSLFPRTHHSRGLSSKCCWWQTPYLFSFGCESAHNASKLAATSTTSSLSLFLFIAAGMMCARAAVGFPDAVHQSEGPLLLDCGGFLDRAFPPLLDAEGLLAWTPHCCHSELLAVWVISQAVNSQVEKHFKNSASNKVKTVKWWLPFYISCDAN
ncbi:hypothetical protein LR48_Vigan07g135500 [Vigna angularis]|uniref:Homeobox domain-containing protein n=1 Tax=Phaseolus angularis TaxID=3914 RepID=A0A0L9UY79_PHAAN|nr:hypothetical protein LR48_Vigan07g135500 [Vigna angularis]